ncbi:MAG: hypothetical protein NVS4B10_19920 [Myxococcales bacterium]
MAVDDDRLLSRTNLCEVPREILDRKVSCALEMAGFEFLRRTYVEQGRACKNQAMCFG